MATNYPGALDSYTTKNAGNIISESHVNNLQDAVVAIETREGIGASTPVADTRLIGTGAGTSVWGKAIIVENRTDDTGMTATGQIWFRTDV